MNKNNYKLIGISPDGNEYSTYYEFRLYRQAAAHFYLAMSCRRGKIVNMKTGEVKKIER